MTTEERFWPLVTTDAGTKEDNYLGVIQGPVGTDDVLYVQMSDASGLVIGEPGRFHGVDLETGENLPYINRSEKWGGTLRQATSVG